MWLLWGNYLTHARWFCLDICETFRKITVSGKLSLLRWNCLCSSVTDIETVYKYVNLSFKERCTILMAIDSQTQVSEQTWKMMLLWLCLSYLRDWLERCGVYCIMLLSGTEDSVKNFLLLIVACCWWGFVHILLEPVEVLVNLWWEIRYLQCKLWLQIYLQRGNNLNRMSIIMKDESLKLVLISARYV